MNPSETLRSIRANLSSDGRKVTQKQMAVYFGTSPQRYSAMETGRHEFSVRDRLLIACMARLMRVGLLRAVFKKHLETLDGKSDSKSI